MWRTLVLLALLPIGLLAGFSAQPAVPAQAVTTVEVRLTEFALTPAQVTVPQGSPVQFTVTNAGRMAHNFALRREEEGAVGQTLFDADLQPGETRAAAFTFRNAGIWRMYDPLDGQAELGVQGEIDILAVADGGAAPSASASCAFRLGFAALHDQIPDIVGACTSDESHNPDNGDALQTTTGGLLVWRKADNWTAFTDGATTWINGPFGLQSRPNDQRFDWESPSPSPAAVGYLVGQATLGPLSPVERVGVPPSTPTPAMCSARGLEIDDVGSQALVTQFSLQGDCSYSVALPPGVYVVRLAPEVGIGGSKDLPASVEIQSGQTVRLDIAIDTGIR